MNIFAHISDAFLPISLGYIFRVGFTRSKGMYIVKPLQTVIKPEKLYQAILPPAI